MRRLNDLRTRRIIPWTAAYLAGGWGGLQVLSLLSDSYGWPPFIMRTAPVLLVGGLFLVVLMAWFHGDAGRQRPVFIEVILAAIIIAMTAGTAMMVGRTRPSEDAIAVAALPRAEAEVPVAVRDDFVRARYFIGQSNPAALDSAVLLLERIVERSPDFALGHAQLALAYTFQASTFRAGDRAFEQKALIAAERALALDPRIPDAHSARGRIIWTRTGGYAHAEAAAEFQHTLALRPNDYDAMFQLAQVLMHIGELDEAIELHDRAVRINPVDPRPRVFKALSILYKGDVATALDMFRVAPPDFNPGFIAYHVAWSLWRLQQYDEASSRLNDALERDADDAGVLTSMRAVLHAHAGRAREASADIARAAASNRNSIQYHHAAYNIALAYVQLAQRDSAMHWLRVAADEGLPCYPLIAADPDLAALRGDPRFDTLLADLQRRRAQFRTTYAALSRRIEH